MSLLLGSNRMQQCIKQQTADASISRPAVQVCRGPRPQIVQQHNLAGTIRQQTSSHARRLQPLQARRRSPVIAPDIAVGNGEEQVVFDLYNYLLRQRIVFVSGYMNDKLATQVVGSLLALEAMDESAEIRMYINSPGGQPYSIIGVVDAMQVVKCPIQTVTMGACYSYSSLILAAGAKGRRFSMKNTRIMMTQPMGVVVQAADGSINSWNDDTFWQDVICPGGSQGDIYAISETVKELNAIYQLFAKYYMKFTAMSPDEIEQNTCRDTFMTPEQAVDYGLIDDVFTSENDWMTPPAVYRQLEEAGIIDRLSGGILAPSTRV